MKEYFACDARREGSVVEVDVILSANELKAIRYIGGYVARQLLCGYEKKKEVIQQYCDCLGEMAVEVEWDELQTYIRKNQSVRSLPNQRYLISVFC